jgi:hypothetical protein
MDENPMSDPFAADEEPADSYPREPDHDTGRSIPDLHADSYSVQDIANLLGMNPEVIQHAVQTGELQADRAGHNIVAIHRADLLAWLNARGPGV